MSTINDAVMQLEDSDNDDAVQVEGGRILIKTGKIGTNQGDDSYFRMGVRQIFSPYGFVDVGMVRVMYDSSGSVQRFEDLGG